jgi:hypothetical protein
VTGATCLELTFYSKDEQTQMAAELRAMPPGTLVAGKAMPDLGRMRDGTRECQKAQGTGTK